MRKKHTADSDGIPKRTSLEILRAHADTLPSNQPSREELTAENERLRGWINGKQEEWDDALYEAGRLKTDNAELKAEVMMALSVREQLIRHLKAENAALKAGTTAIEVLDEIVRLRRGIDNIKIRSYELGQRELHDMALGLLKGNVGE